MNTRGPLVETEGSKQFLTVLRLVGRESSIFIRNTASE